MIILKLQKFCVQFQFIISVLLTVFLVLGANTAASGEEKILNFDSNVVIAKDGRLQVLDSIIVQAEKRLIKRGIYRDFSTRLIQPDGSIVRVGYTITEVLRDGEPEPFFTQKSEGNLRLYIGHEDYFLAAGTYRYDIRYEADRQFITTDTQDILNWNVTGNYWPFDIENTSVKLHLPQDTQLDGFKFFTGRVGSIAAQGDIETSPDGKSLGVDVSTTLQRGEGLTVFLQLQKGSISAPSTTQQLLWYWRDNFEELFVGIVLALVTFYYLFVWARVGRDPRGGVVVPRWRISKHISPALVHYIQQRGFGQSPFKAVTAAIVSLATKNMVTIETNDENISIARASQGGIVDARKLPAGEAAIFDRIDDHHPMLLAKSNGTSVRGMVTAFRAAVEKEHRNKYFKINRGYCIFGIILSVLGLFILLANIEGVDLAYFPAFLVVGGGSIVLGLMFIKLLQLMRSDRKYSWQFFLAFIPVAAFLFGASTFGIELMKQMDIAKPYLLLGLVGLFGINVLFFFLMRAPTPIGRTIMDEIEGLSVYLNLAEKDRMNLANAPQMSPIHFEELLPMAIALGVEKPWSATFDNWLKTATATQMAQAAGGSWHGHSINNPEHLGNELSQLSRSLEDGMSSAMPPASSSSSGSSSSFGGGGFSSGGFSGGGGGSSGGGGW